MSSKYSLQSKLAGLVWFVVGAMLLMVGARLLAPSLSSYVGQLGLLFALILGALKGRFVLRKVARRVLDRLASLPESTPVWAIYNVRQVSLIGSMMLLGMMMRYFQVDSLYRGILDVAVGSALLMATPIYFRSRSIA